jgi:hypothetical protein
MFGTFDLLMGLFVWFCVPETKGLSLEQMDELFGVGDLHSKLDAEGPEGARTPSIREEIAEAKSTKN